MDKNLYLIGILIILFSIDILKVKYFPDPVVKPQVDQEKASTGTVDETIKNLTDDDLKLEEENEKSIKEQSISDETDKLMIVISHCSSHSGSASNIQKDLLSHLTNADINLETYPLDESKAFLSKLLTYAQYGFFLFLMILTSLRNSLTFIPPKVFDFIENKKFMIGMVAYFVISQLQSSVSRTGAFEVKVNNELIYSALENKILPTVEVLLHKIQDLGLLNN